MTVDAPFADLWSWQKSYRTMLVSDTCVGFDARPDIFSPQHEYSKVRKLSWTGGNSSNGSYAEAGWIGRDAILMTGINAIIYVLSTVPP